MQKRRIKLTRARRAFFSPYSLCRYSLERELSGIRVSSPQAPGANPLQWQPVRTLRTRRPRGPGGVKATKAMRGVVGECRFGVAVPESHNGRAAAPTPGGGSSIRQNSKRRPTPELCRGQLPRELRAGGRLLFRRRGRFGLRFALCLQTGQPLSVENLLLVCAAEPPG